MALRVILHNTAWLGLVQALGYILPLFTIPVVSRALGPELFGFLATTNAVAAYVGVLILFGFPMTGPREIARTTGEAEAISRAVSRNLSAQALLAASGSVAFIALIYGTSIASRSDTAALLILATAVAGSLTPAWVLLGLERMREMVLPQLVTRILATFLIIAFVRSPDDLLLYVGLNAAAAWGCLLWCALVLRKAGIRYRLPAMAGIREALARSYGLFISNFAITVYTAGNVLVVGLILGSTAAGIFALADRIRTTALGVYGPMTQAIYPFICRTMGVATAQEQRAKQQFFALMLFISVLISAAMFFAAEALIAVFGGKEFAEATTLLKIFSLTPVLVVVSNILGNQTLIPLGLDRQVTMIVTAAAILGTVLLIFFSKLFGVTGSAISYVITEAAVAASCAIAFRHRQRSSKARS